MTKLFLGITLAIALLQGCATPTTRNTTPLTIDFERPSIHMPIPSDMQMFFSGKEGGRGNYVNATWNKVPLDNENFIFFKLDDFKFIDRSFGIFIETLRANFGVWEAVDFTDDERFIDTGEVEIDGKLFTYGVLLNDQTRILAGDGFFIADYYLTLMVGRRDNKNIRYYFTYGMNVSDVEADWTNTPPLSETQRDALRQLHEEARHIFDTISLSRQ